MTIIRVPASLHPRRASEGASVIQPPADLPQKTKPIVFLAGSIEQGKAEDWQKQVSEGLKDMDIYILNPRREDWDDSWEQSLENEQFVGQVEWELKGQETASLILMYLDPETKSPITMLELGLFNQPEKLIVCCPEGFYRKGNIDVTCRYYGIRQVGTLEELIEGARKALTVKERVF